MSCVPVQEAAPIPVPAPTQSIQDMRFRFSSGDPHHPEGFGAWTVTLEGRDRAHIVHTVGGSVKDFGPLELTAWQSKKLWEAILVMDSTELDTASRKGLPDETRYLLTLETEQQEYDVAIWSSDASDNEAITALIQQIESFIRTTTGTEPILR